MSKLTKISIAVLLLGIMMLAPLATNHSMAMATDNMKKSITPKQEGVEVTLRLMGTAVSSVERIVRIVADGIEKAGIKVELDLVDFNTLLARLDRGDFNAAFFGFSLGILPTFLQAFASWSISNQLLWRFTNDSYDAAVYDFLTNRTFNGTLAAAWRAERILYEQQPIVPIYQNDLIMAARNDTFYDYFNFPGDGLDNYWNYIWVKPKGSRTEFISSLPQQIESLNPLTTTSAYSWRVLGFMYEGLWAWDPHTLEPIPWLAENWTTTTVVENGKELFVINVTLRDGLKWSDGTPLTAEDFAFTYWLANYTKAKTMYDALTYWKNITVYDDRHFAIFDTNPAYIEFFMVTLAPLPRHIWGDPTRYGNYTSMDQVPPSVILSVEPFDPNNPNKAKDWLVSCGPFIIDDLGSDFVTLTKNPYYFNAPSSTIAPHNGDYVGPYVDKVTFKLIVEESSAVQALLNGEIDMIGDFLSSTAVAQLEGQPNIQIVATARRGFGHVSFNTKKFPGSIPAFRRAVAMAIDKNRVVNEVWGGRGRAIDIPVPPSQGIWSIEDNLYPHYYESRIDLANATLEAAGFVDVDGDGWREFAPSTTGTDNVAPQIIEVKSWPLYPMNGTNVTIMAKIYENQQIDTVMLSYTPDVLLTYYFHVLPPTLVPMTYNNDTGYWEATITVNLTGVNDLSWWGLDYAYAIGVDIIANDTSGNVGSSGLVLVYALAGIDNDHDGMDDGWEVINFLDPTDPHDAAYDYDEDGLLNYEEYFYKTNPIFADTDYGGAPDGFEVKYGFNPNDPTDDTKDADNDGLTNVEEANLGTNPLIADTDGDGLTDGYENNIGTNPLLADTDGDGFTDKYEVDHGTDPLDPESTPTVGGATVDNIQTLDNGTVVITLSNGTTITVPPQTVTQPVTDMTMVGGVGILTLIIGIVVGLFIGKKQG